MCIRDRYILCADFTISEQVRTETSPKEQEHGRSPEDGRGENHYGLLTWGAGIRKLPVPAAAARAAVPAARLSWVMGTSCCVRERARSTMPSNIGISESAGSGW